MKRLRWLWPLILIALALLAPWLAYLWRPGGRLEIVLVDKTVPFENRIEHRSLFWLLDHLKIRHRDGRPYESTRDYLGAFPGPVPGDPPERTVSLTPDRAAVADLLYLADTYGVYEKDLESGYEMKAALERSPKIYGGLEGQEADAVESALRAGKTVIVEFNSFASPTPRPIRRRMEALLGVRWTDWIGRHFSALDDESEVPQWVRDVYEAEWSRPWRFTGPGYVLLEDDRHCEVLQLGVDVGRRGLTLERGRPVEPPLIGARDGVSYSYWFDVVEAGPNTETLAWYQWRMNGRGHLRLSERGLPDRFPAVVRKRHAAEKGGVSYYFAGDFIDNPMPELDVPLAGYPLFMRDLGSLHLAPSEQAFYWRFYVPMMTRLLEDLAG